MSLTPDREPYEGLPAAATLYLELLRKCLTRELLEESYTALNPTSGRLGPALAKLLRAGLSSLGLELVRRVPVAERHRVDGRGWPTRAETMIGSRRLQHLQACVMDVLERGVPGDLIEAGAWRGGATILMRACLKVRGDTERIVWVADSFQGLPRPDPTRYPADAKDRLWTCPQLVVSLEEVKANFARYGLLDSQVRFLAGWFRDTLPSAPIRELAVLRIDADMYESTMLALRHLYPKLAAGGYVIVDDYGILSSCRTAVEDFRAEVGIDNEVRWIDHSAVFWQRRKGG